MSDNEYEPAERPAKKKTLKIQYVQLPEGASIQPNHPEIQIRPQRAKRVRIRASTKTRVNCDICNEEFWKQGMSRHRIACLKKNGPKSEAEVAVEHLQQADVPQEVIQAPVDQTPPDGDTNKLLDITSKMYDFVTTQAQINKEAKATKAAIKAAAKAAKHLQQVEAIAAPVRTQTPAPQAVQSTPLPQGDPVSETDESEYEDDEQCNNIGLGFLCSPQVQRKATRRGPVQHIDINDFF